MKWISLTAKLPDTKNEVYLNTFFLMALQAYLCVYLECTNTLFNWKNYCFVQWLLHNPKDKFDNVEYIQNGIEISYWPSQIHRILRAFSAFLGNSVRWCNWGHSSGMHETQSQLLHSEKKKFCQYSLKKQSNRNKTMARKSKNNYPQDIICFLSSLYPNRITRAWNKVSVSFWIIKSKTYSSS